MGASRQRSESLRALPRCGGAQITVHGRFRHIFLARHSGSTAKVRRGSDPSHRAVSVTPVTVTGSQ